MTKADLLGTYVLHSTSRIRRFMKKSFMSYAPSTKFSATTLSSLQLRLDCSAFPMDSRTLHPAKALPFLTLSQLLTPWSFPAKRLSPARKKMSQDNFVGKVSSVPQCWHLSMHHRGFCLFLFVAPHHHTTLHYSAAQGLAKKFSAVLWVKNGLL